MCILKFWAKGLEIYLWNVGLPMKFPSTSFGLVVFKLVPCSLFCQKILNSSSIYFRVMVIVHVDNIMVFMDEYIYESNTVQNSILFLLLPILGCKTPSLSLLFKVLPQGMDCDDSLDMQMLTCANICAMCTLPFSSGRSPFQQNKTKPGKFVSSYTQMLLNPSTSFSLSSCISFTSLALRLDCATSLFCPRVVVLLLVYFQLELRKNSFL